MDKRPGAVGRVGTTRRAQVGPALHRTVAARAPDVMRSRVESGGLGSKGGMTVRTAEIVSANGDAVVVFEVDTEEGWQPVGVEDQVVGRFEDVLAPVRVLMDEANRALVTAAPSEVELEFGLKISAEAGAFIAKATGEAHIVVRVKWSPKGPS
jgi:Trypsin-co-occurring domain 1